MLQDWPIDLFGCECTLFFKERGSHEGDLEMISTVTPSTGPGGKAVFSQVSKAGAHLPLS